MDVAAKTLTTESPSYSTIMALDRSIREFPNPDSMSDSNANFSNSSQRNVLDHVRETGKSSRVSRGRDLDDLPKFFFISTEASLPRQSSNTQRTLSRVPTLLRSLLRTRHPLLSSKLFKISLSDGLELALRFGLCGPLRSVLQ